MGSTRFGLTLSSEEHPPGRLVELAVAAEEHGFDFVSVSDHFHPWLNDQGHAPFVWAVLGAVAARTSRIEVGTGVTCPIMRMHPAIVAHAAATAACLLPGRFIFGLGSGEALNEHITGERWPPAGIRIAMLREATEIVRQLFTGESVTHRGTHFTVEDARLFDPPPTEVPIVLSAFGESAARLAAEVGDGLWMSTPSKDTVQHFHDAGGRGPVFAQIDVCVHDDVAEARRIAHRQWRTAGVPGQLSQDLPTVAHFEQASSIVTEEMVADAIVCGPDVTPIVDAIEKAVDAGVDNVYLHQIGPDQERFLQMWDHELSPEMERLR